MPHVIVKLWPGKSEEQKTLLARRIVKDVMEILHYGEESVSVTMEEVAPREWTKNVCKPDIAEEVGHTLQGTLLRAVLSG